MKINQSDHSVWLTFSKKTCSTSKSCLLKNCLLNHINSETIDLLLTSPNCFAVAKLSCYLLQTINISMYWFMLWRYVQMSSTYNAHRKFRGNKRSICVWLAWVTIKSISSFFHAFQKFPNTCKCIKTQWCTAESMWKNNQLYLTIKCLFTEILLP